MSEKRRRQARGDGETGERGLYGAVKVEGVS